MKKQKAIIVVDLTFGDAGKGSMVDYLARKHQAHTVIRFNGGAQAAHNVITSDGIHHTFSQFGSGTLIPGVRTYLSKFMMVDPIFLFTEAKKLENIGIRDALKRILADEKALITTPFHIAANRLREMARGEGRHGSCGKGIGETMSDFVNHGEKVLFAGDIRDEKIMRGKLRFIQENKRKELEGIISTIVRNENTNQELDIIESDDVVNFTMKYFERFRDQVEVCGQEKLQEILAGRGTVIFEGAQGVLIDEWYGFHPYTTWSTTTAKNALTLLEECEYQGEIEKLGLVRAYATRHGPGPFVTEDQELGRKIPDIHNQMDRWQREFRVGWFDLVAARYAIEVCGGIDKLAVTNIDRFIQLSQWKLCESYHFPEINQEEVEDQFVMEKNFKTNVARRIRVKKELEDLDFQQKITDLLNFAKPIYRVLGLGNEENISREEEVERYLGALEQELAVPVDILSFGPTAEDKREYGKE